MKQLLARSLLVSCALYACARRSDQEPAAEPGAGPAAAEEPVAGSGVLRVSAEDQEHMGLALAAPESFALAPEELAFGRVISDPARQTTLRAPLSGTLLAADVKPAFAAELAAGAVVFRLAPRWTPQERADLSARQSAARAELAAAEAELPARRSALERARGLNAADKSVSDRELEETGRELAVAEARVSGARELLGALVAALGSGDVPPMALVLPAAGEVVELLAHAGETVEAGTPLLAVEDFSQPLVALDLPLDADSPSAATFPRARIVTGAGRSETYLTAERVGLAPSAGTAGLASAVLFRVAAGQPGAAELRPGLMLRAYLASSAPAQAGLCIPRAAVVRYAGRAFVFARTGAESFERRALELEHPIEGGWFVAASWSGGAPSELVVRGAQALLSFELLGRQGAEEE